jgi:hypothetical protein
MNPERSAAAQTLLDGVAARSGLQPDVAHAATTLVAAFLVANLTPFRVNDLRKRVGELDELAEEGRVRAADIAEGRGLQARATLTGRVLSSVGGMVGGKDGGPVSATMVLIGNLGKLGLDVGDMRTLSNAMIAQLRRRVGPQYVDTMIERAKAKVPILGSYLG